MLRVLLISTYELGHQPFGLASPAAWLRPVADVCCLDLSRQKLREDWVRDAGLVAFYVPMHTATRLAARTAEQVRRLNPVAHLCFYGLYATVNAGYLRSLGGQTILGGEFEEGLLRLAQRLAANQSREREREEASGCLHAPSPAAEEPAAGEGRKTSQPADPEVSLARLQFRVPDRTGLPPLAEYARLHLPGGERRVAGYTEASRGCKHLCRHCPIVPVYNGAFRIVQPEIVIEDIARQVAAGAQHITFGDPDFFNGPTHAIRIVRQLHERFPEISYDVTIKIEHLLKHADALPALRDTGGLFITSAAESVDDRILARLDKGHTRADFRRAVELCAASGLHLSPTFVPFTPWTTAAGYCDLLSVIVELGLVGQVAPVQLAIRLLIPAGSRLLELDDVREWVEGTFQQDTLAFAWRHPEPAVDRLAADVQRQVWLGEKRGDGRRQIFARVWKLAHEAAGADRPLPAEATPFERTGVPYLNEPWYC